MMFKVGDRVKYKDGTTFSNGEFVNTVEKVSEGYQVWLMETGRWANAERLEYESPATSPVRTVTRREIVPGRYGMVEVGKTELHGDLRVAIRFANRNHGMRVSTSEELREAAHILNQLAEVLEENK